MTQDILTGLQSDMSSASFDAAAVDCASAPISDMETAAIETRQIQTAEYFTNLRTSESEYFLITDRVDPIRIDIYNYQDLYQDIFLLYWVRVLQQIEETGSAQGLTFYIVWQYQRVRELPSYGQNVVVIIVSDEQCLIPHYAGKVRFVFRTYGFRPWISPSFRGNSLSGLLKYTKDSAICARHFAKFCFEQGAFTSRRKRKVLPLGYARQTDVAVKPFAARRYLVGFIGSIAHEPYRRFSARDLLGTPKTKHRSDMANSLGRLAAKMPNDVFYATTGSYEESILGASATRYSEVMADTKICLAPRGTSAETYRLVEGMRQGCVVICNPLPPHWFYVGCPAIQIDDWRHLEAEVEALMANPDRLLDLHHRSLEWWAKMFSEPAVARVIAGCLASEGG